MVCCKRKSLVLGSRSEQQLRAASSVRPPDWAVVLPWPHCCITDDCPRECKRYPHSASFSLLSIYIDLPIQVEKAMAPHSSTLAWKIPWTEEPGRLQSMGSRRVGHDWATSLSLFTFMHWKRQWQPTPVFLPGEFQGRGSLVGCHLWGRTESDTTEAT